MPKFFDSVAVAEDGSVVIQKMDVTDPRKVCFSGSGETSNLLTAVVLDTETTSVEAHEAEVIELSAAKFRFTDDFRVVDVVDVFSQLNQPSKPLDPKVVEVTGLTDDDLRGRILPKAEFLDFISEAEFLVAHNHEYDKKVLINHFGDSMRGRTWVDTFKHVDWNSMGVGSQKLDYLAFVAGFYYDAHRALPDCLATLRILDGCVDGRCIFEEAVVEALEPKSRVLAWRSPFETKGVLRRNGYYWDGELRTWYKVVHDKDVESEVDFLETCVYMGRSQAEVREEKD